MEEKTKILLCEDDENLGTLLCEYLIAKGFDAVLCPDGEVGFREFQKDKFDICVLDVMMPKKDGFTLAQDIRQINSQVPIIFLTARVQKEDILEGFDKGADDYITKPFAVPELIARLKNALRRRDISTEDASDRLTVKNLIMFLSRYEVQVDGETVALTKREYDLLEYLLRNKRTVLTRDQILQEVWGFDYTGETNVVDVYIRYLRAKLDDRFNKKYIYTVRGVGYVVRD